MSGRRKLHIAILAVLALTAVLSIRGYFVSTALKSAKSDFLQADYLLIEGNVGLSPREIVSVDQRSLNPTGISSSSDPITLFSATPGGDSCTELARQKIFRCLSSHFRNYDDMTNCFLRPGSTYNIRGFWDCALFILSKV